MKRRDLLKWSGLLATTPFLKYTSVRGEEPQRILEFELTAKESVQNLAGPEYPDTRLWLYNDRLGGPFLKARQGDLLQVRFRNQLPCQHHSLHGIRNINAMDGVAGLTQDLVPPGEEFTYTVPLTDAEPIGTTLTQWPGNR